MKTVLAFIDSIGSSHQGKFDGMRSVARERGWRLLVVSSVRDAESARRLVRGISPDGVIVQGYWPLATDGRPPAAAWRGIPCVYLDTAGAAGAGSVATDSAAVARMALRELSKTGPASLVFATGHAGAAWSHLRGREARAFAARAEIPFAELDLGNLRAHDVAAVLRRAPRPVALFAANDEVAAEIYPQIAEAGLAFGRDVAVVAVDDNAMICETLSPRLSSVALDHHGVGRSAALMLARLMDSGEGGRLLVAPSELVRRGSSIPAQPSSAITRKARAFIEEHAADGIAVADVAQACGVSRRSLEIDFHAKTGATVHQAILDKRFERVEALLSNRHQLLQPIARLCGWESPAHLKRAFKARYGMTMRAFRAARARRPS